MGLVAELKRRNVIRMAGLYLVGAWLVTQVASTVLPVLEAPAWAMKAVLGVLAAGFLPALGIAWAFELTPEGLRRDTAVASDPAFARRTGRRLERTIVVVLALAVGFFAIHRFVLAPQRAAATVAAGSRDATVTPPRPIASDKSIAVLPFVNMSADKDNEYFSDGVAEEILNGLAQVKDLKVAGRTSSFRFKGRNGDITAIGEALGVAHVLEGSVRKQGDRVRITAQLIRAKDGYHQWSETYDGDLGDVFALQERIAQAIVAKLQLSLTGSQARRIVDAGTKDKDAYQLFLRASSTFDRRDATRMREASQQLQQAVAIDPAYARAWSRLAAVHAILPTYIAADRQSGTVEKQVSEYARRAIALDPRLAEPWAAMGLAAPLSGSGLLQSRDYFEKALSLEPDDITSNFWYGLALARSGYHRAAIDRLEHALEIDPLVPNLMRWRGVLYLRDGDVAHAEPYLRRAHAAGLRLAGRELGEILAARGQREEARRLWAEGSYGMVTLLPAADADAVARGVLGGDEAARRRAVAALDAYLARDGVFVPGMVAFWLAQLGRGAQAMDVELTRVQIDNSDFMALLFSTSGAPLRALPEFPAYVEAKGLPALWDRYGAPDMCTKAADGRYACR